MNKVTNFAAAAAAAQCKMKAELEFVVHHVISCFISLGGSLKKQLVLCCRELFRDV